ncbi:retrovirus-related pol polyprotein from transposon 17.6, partial [Tanacetum coccineum]
MQHPVDGGAWKKFDMKYPDFTKEPRNVRLGLCADGFNPFGNLSQTYSMWPVILTTYNLPPWLCMKESNFMLTLLWIMADIARAHGTGTVVVRILHVHLLHHSVARVASSTE